MSIFGCTDDAVRRCDDCVTEEANRIIHVAFVKKGTTINTSTAALLSSTLLAAELACNAFIIRNVNGTKDAPSIQEGKGAGKQTTRILGKQHTINFTDFNYVSNISFWNAFERSAIGYDMYYFTDSKAWKVTGAQISVAASDPITDDNSTFIEGTVMAKWTQKGNPLAYDATTDDFESCQELFDGTSLTWVNRSGGDSVISGSTITQDEDSLINVAADTDANISSVEIEEGVFPTGVSVSYSGQGIVISGTPTETGTFEVTIRASNACGIAGLTTVTIIVE